MITWADLSAEEREALLYLGGYCDTDNVTPEGLEALDTKQLAEVTTDHAWYGKDYNITDAGRAVLAQATDTAPAVGAVSDGVALARAQIARLQSALETIRDYPTVEADMDLGHQVAGMAMQAEVALDEVPVNSGLLTILANKLEAAQSDLAASRQRVAALEAALETCITSKSKVLWLGAQAFDIYRRATGGVTLWGGLTEGEQKAWIEVGSKMPSIALIKSKNTPDIVVPSGHVAPVWAATANATAYSGDATFNGFDLDYSLILTVPFKAVESELRKIELGETVTVTITRKANATAGNGVGDV